MKRLKLEPNQLEQLVQQTLTHLISGKKSVTVSIESMLQLPSPQPPDKPEIKFSEEAYAKMKTLVSKADNELAWHGLVRQTAPKQYYIYDILVYPQRVTKATVESDDDLYPIWLDELDDDQFNSIRMQGHSHVNMGTTPSGTDDELYSTLTKHISDYYIFIIMNKSDRMWINLYDMKENVVYETADIVLIREGKDYSKWFEKEYEDMVDEANTYAYYHGTQQKKVKSIGPSYAKEQKEMRERYQHYMSGGDYR